MRWTMSRMFDRAGGGTGTMVAEPSRAEPSAELRPRFRTAPTHTHRIPAAPPTLGGGAALALRQVQPTRRPPASAARRNRVLPVFPAFPVAPSPSPARPGRVEEEVSATDAEMEALSLHRNEFRGDRNRQLHLR